MSAPSGLGLWIWALFAGSAAYYLCRKYPWSALFVVPFSLLLPLLSFLSDRTAPVEGSPNTYTLHASAVVTVVLAAAVIGMVQGGFRPWSLHAIEVADRRVSEGRMPERPDTSEQNTTSAARVRETNGSSNDGTA